jgi:hypothetical protein
MKCSLVLLLSLVSAGWVCAQVQEKWVARYHNLGSVYDIAYAVAVDAADNVYVTGQSAGTGTNLDYTTAKYDPDGNELWVARYDGLANNNDASAIALNAAGNVCVTGRSANGPLSSDFATVTYAQQ